MISLKESNQDILNISKKHFTYVKPYVNNMIMFYLDLFKLLPTFYGKKLTDKKVIEQILAIKRKYSIGHYKRLLKYLLKGKTPLKNDGDLKLFKFTKNLKIDATKNIDIIKALNSLLKHYEEILSFEINGNEPLKITKYQLWKKECEPIQFLLNGIFDYEDWFLNLDTSEMWGPYQLAKSLNIRSCPYCNRSYTLSLTDSQGTKKGRPDFDHFLPKSLHPLLALSFFNLVPSCKICNGPSIKSGKPVDYDTHLNPYEDNKKHELMRFTYYPNTYEASIGMSEDVEVELKYAGDVNDKELKKKVEGNISLFYLAETYQQHRDIVQEIIRKRIISSDRYLEELQNTYSHFNLTIDEAYRYAFGNYYKEEEFHKRPIAKLTKDIAIEMGVFIKIKKS